METGTAIISEMMASTIVPTKAEPTPNEGCDPETFHTWVCKKPQ